MNSKRNKLKFIKRAHFQMGVQNKRVSLILRWRTEWNLQATMIQKSFMNSAGRKKFQSLKTNLTEAILSFSKINKKIEENNEKSESDHSHAKQLRFKTNYELLAELDIIEILTEESGSEIEDI